jgi:hypothetical protein
MVSACQFIEALQSQRIIFNFGAFGQTITCFCANDGRVHKQSRPCRKEKQAD